MLGVGALIFDNHNGDNHNGDNHNRDHHNRDNERRILLVQRGGEPLKGLWSLPGGALETGETLADGVRREVLEETGLVVEPVRLFEIFERIMRDPEGRAEYHYVLMDYICRITGGSLAAADDCADVRWVPRKELPELCITEGTLGVIEKAYGFYE